MSERALMIGGPRDGESAEAVLKRLLVFTPRKFDINNPPSPYESAGVESVYHAEQFCSGEKRLIIYRHESIKLDDMMGLLIANYRPAKLGQTGLGVTHS